MLAEQFLEPSIIFYRLGWNPRSVWTKVRFDGAVLSNLDIKRCIMTHERLLADPDIYDLVLTNMQTGEEFRDEGFLVPRNSALVARKIPCTKGASQRIRQAPLTIDSSKSVENIYGGGRIIGNPTAEKDASVADFLAKGDDFAEVSAGVTVPGIPNPQGDLSRSAFGLGGLRFAYRFDPQAKPPPGYICHRCEQPGHFIRFCPTNDDPNFNFRRIKPATGIPVSFMKPASDPNPASSDLAGLGEAGAEQTGSTVRLGDDAPARALPNQRQFARTLAETGSDAVGAVCAGGAEAQPAAELRAELKCALCGEPFVNAVMAVCCFSSFCDVCIRRRIGDADSAACPSCNKNTAKSDLKPNKVFQKAVDEYVESHPEKANKRISKHLRPDGIARAAANPEFLNPFSDALRRVAAGRHINPNNTCFRCGQKGHYMADCRNEADRNAYHPSGMKDSRQPKPGHHRRKRRDAERSGRKDARPRYRVSK